MNYWFYLEPYAFLFHNENKAVIYNTLNSAYLVCPNHPIIQQILVQWEDAANGYGVELNEDALNESVVKHFINDIRESFSGDCLEIDFKYAKPYIFKPTLFLNTDIRIKEDKNKTSLGERILQNLHEVTLFFPSSCIQSCAACSSYYRQMNHCTTCHEDALKIEDYIHLLHQFQVCGIQRVNLVAGGNPLQNRYTRNLSIDFTGSTFKKHLYLEYNFLNNEYIEFAQQTNSILEILVHSGDLNNQLAESMQKYQHDMVRWNLIVSAETDLAQLDRLILPENILIQIRPFYNGSNYNFFHDFVFFDLQDILVEPIDRKTIFRHKVLNDNFFGKLTIFPSGEVFANVNCSTIGNIQKSSLKELVYKELTELETWLKVRSKETPCKQCINKDLCPSISNYELVIGKNNLCNIQHR